MRIGSLFSGAGGLDMAVEAVFGGQVVWQSEIDPAASKVLAHRYPSVPNLGDITQVDWATRSVVKSGRIMRVEPVDVLCGGFPCQDVSVAGKRAGIKDGTRSGLWSVFAEAIEQLRPQFVVIENVRGLLSATAHRNVEPDNATLGNGGHRPVLRAGGAVVGTLADLGYSSRWTTLSASSVGAPHQRERVFIVANLNSEGLERDWAQRDKETKQPEYGCDSGLARIGELGLAGVVQTFLPTPSTHDSTGARSPKSIAKMDKPFSNLNDTAVNELLSTPQARDSKGAPKDAFNQACLARDIIDCDVAWGKYEPAIRRWETLCRPAPKPTEPGVSGLKRPRLNPQFSEWMMGWPAGWVTDLGLTRKQQLQIIGNGVVPQQAAAALLFLLMSVGT